VILFVTTTKKNKKIWRQDVRLLLNHLKSRDFVCYDKNILFDRKRKYYFIYVDLGSIFLLIRLLFLFTPKFKRRVVGTRKLPRTCHQGINCVQIGTSWFECNTGIGFLQVMPADNNKCYDQRRDQTCWTIQKRKDYSLSYLKLEMFSPRSKIMMSRA